RLQARSRLAAASAHTATADHGPDGVTIRTGDEYTGSDHTALTLRLRGRRLHRYAYRGSSLYSVRPRSAQRWCRSPFDPDNQIAAVNVYEFLGRPHVARNEVLGT
ncbi:MAG: hypothetical protein M3N23_01470, partial [Pseudomonadota bacterium]|nr:hypothetical protein [Pseudomonadota bacterium]